MDGARTWRLLHYASFAVLVLAVAHGLGAGTDAQAAPMLGLYIVTGAVLVFLTCYRILVRIETRPAARTVSAAGVSAPSPVLGGRRRIARDGGA